MMVSTQQRGGTYLGGKVPVPAASCGTYVHLAPHTVSIPFFGIFFFAVLRSSFDINTDVHCTTQTTTGTLHQIGWLFTVYA